jgi:hypothetical protein
MTLLPGGGAPPSCQRRSRPASLAAAVFVAGCLAGLCGCGGRSQPEAGAGTAPAGPMAPVPASRLSASPRPGSATAPGTKPKKNRLGGEEP